MHRLGCFIFITFLGLAALGGCKSHRTPPGKPLTIIVGETVMYQRPDRLSPKVSTLTYGQQIFAMPKRPFSIVGDWAEIRLDDDRSGFVKESSLGTPEIMETFQKLKKSIEGVEPQASGITIAPTNFRLEPGRQGKPVEKLPKGTRFDMFERQATSKSNAPADPTSNKPLRKDVWYKVRLSDGRIGYIYSSNFKLEPPSEISDYTHFRRTLAWLKLRTVEGDDSESVHEYLVAYATPAVDFGADFDRIEIYFWDGEQYQTAFVASSLRGILPIHIIREGKNIFYEFTELDSNHEKQVIISRYPYAYPYKRVSRVSLAKDVGLH